MVWNDIYVEPLFGEIDAESTKAITVKFSPVSYGIFIAEYEFKHSEYDYKNIKIQISGSCNTFDKVLHENLVPKKAKSPKKYALKEKQTVSFQSPNLLVKLTK